MASGEPPQRQITCPACTPHGELSRTHPRAYLFKAHTHSHTHRCYGAACAACRSQTRCCADHVHLFRTLLTLPVLPACVPACDCKVSRRPVSWRSQPTRRRSSSVILPTACPSSWAGCSPAPRHRRRAGPGCGDAAHGVSLHFDFFSSRQCTLVHYTEQRQRRDTPPQSKTTTLMHKSTRET